MLSVLITRSGHMTDDPLAAHRLCAVKTLEVKSRYPRTVGQNARRGVHGTGPTSQVTVLLTDRGATGWGISGDGPLCDSDVSRLIGKRVAELFDPRVGVVASEANSHAARVLDLALHDLAGTILGQPVYQMLGTHEKGGEGEEGEPTVPCYDGAIYMDDLLPEENPRGIQAILDNCHCDYALGYRAFKLKIGRGYRWMGPEEGLQRDIQVTQAVRKRFGDCDILVDANDGYTCDEFLRYMKAVAGCGLYWIEEPFPENREDLLRLREFLARHSPQTLIADGESGYDVEHLLRLAHEGLVDVLIMDVVGLGFTRWRAWMPRLGEANTYASPHTWGDPLKTLYAAQIAAGLGNVPTVEGIPAKSRDVDWSSYHLQDGRLHVPDAPGFGVRFTTETRRADEYWHI
jgi:D-galactarolactone cycloisomerase